MYVRAKSGYKISQAIFEVLNLETASPWNCVLPDKVRPRQGFLQKHKRPFGLDVYVPFLSTDLDRHTDKVYVQSTAPEPSAPIEPDQHAKQNEERNAQYARSSVYKMYADTAGKLSGSHDEDIATMYRLFKNRCSAQGLFSDYE